MKLKHNINNPLAFLPDNNTQLWVFQNKIAVFNENDAKVVFMYAYGIEGLQVWGIKDCVANLLDSMESAIRFFGEQDESQNEIKKD